MNKKCEDCGKCCIETAMLLSEEDINQITSNTLNNLKKDEFVFRNEDGYYQLQNLDGCCFFFEKPTKLCSIYESRPQGCRFYPMIYNIDENRCIIDKECPRPDLFYKDKLLFNKSCKGVKEFLRNKLKIDL